MIKAFVLKISGWLVVVALVTALVVTFQADLMGLRDQTTDSAATPVLRPIAVSVLPAQREPVQLTVRYAGMLEPLDRYELSFEINGRLVGLNIQDDQPHWDEGDQVQAGQVIARLDTVAWEAECQEESARVVEARRDYQRSLRLRAQDSRAVTLAELHDQETEVKLSQARLRRAQKTLQNATLRSPVNGVIARRLVNPGMTVAAHSPILEILQVERLLLVVGVPEGRIREIELGQPAEISFLRGDVFHRPRKPLQGKVYRVAEAADERTGLFRVEILVPNPQRTLRPGLIAEASIVIHQADSLRVPLDALVSTSSSPSSSASSSSALATQLAGGRAGADLFIVDGSNIARAITISAWAEQGAWAILPDPLPAELSDSPAVPARIVVSGQQRLVDGSSVKIVQTLSSSQLQTRARNNHLPSTNLPSPGPRSGGPRSGGSRSGDRPETTATP